MAFLLAGLGHLSDLSQAYQLRTDHEHQKENIHWTQRAYRLDIYSLKIDLFTAAREDIRGHYHCYECQLDTLLFLNAVLLTFALTVLQFSDAFVPHTEEQCPHCIETEHPWLGILWVWIIAIVFVFPFWSILMLMRCKIRLDNWMESTCSTLNQQRASLFSSSDLSLGSLSPGSTQGSSLPSQSPTEREDPHHDVNQILQSLTAFTVQYKEHFTRTWGAECEPLMVAAKYLLGSSVGLPIGLAGLMFWMFLSNRPGMRWTDSIHFGLLLTLGLLATITTALRSWCFSRCKTQDGQAAPAGHRLNREASISLQSLRATEAPAAAFG